MLAKWFLICLYLPSAAAWDIDFTDRQASLKRFEEDTEFLSTSGCRACAEPSHIHYNQQLTTCKDGQMRPLGRKGLQIVMDYNVSCDHKNVSVATGHMASKEPFMWGTYSFIMRSHHLPDSCEQPQTYAGFSCISLYNYEPVWNEVAICFSKWAPMQEVHLTVYNGEKQAESEKKVPVFGAYVTLDEPTNLDYHNYSVERLPSGISFWVDGKKMIQIDKSQAPNLPTEPMYMKVILRPMGSTIDGNSTLLSIESMSANPFDDATANAMAAEAEKEEATFQDTVTKKYVLVNNFVGSFYDWENVLKMYMFDALEMEYPGATLRDKYPIKLARLLPNSRLLVMKMDTEEQAAKLAAIVNKRGGFTEHRPTLGKVFNKTWEARVITEVEYHGFGAVSVQRQKKPLQLIQRPPLTNSMRRQVVSLPSAILLLGLAAVLFAILSGGAAVGVAAFKHRKLFYSFVPAPSDSESWKQV